MGYFIVFLAVFLLVFAGVLLFPIRLLVNYKKDEVENITTLDIKYMFFTFRAYPSKKPKKNRQEKPKKNKRVEVSEIELPAIVTFKKAQTNFITMSLDECVNYAIEHNPNLAVGLQHIKAAESGIGQQKASFAPRLTARVNYNHLANSGSRIANTHTDSIGFNTGISQLIWDFGKTLARINMAKYDTQSAQFDYDYDILNITYNVKMNYYNVKI